MAAAWCGGITTDGPRALPWGCRADKGAMEAGGWKARRGSVVAVVVGGAASEGGAWVCRGGACWLGAPLAWRSRWLARLVRTPGLEKEQNTGHDYRDRYFTEGVVMQISCSSTNVDLPMYCDA